MIEVARIAAIVLSEKAVPALARDTAFVVVMIVCNGFVLRFWAGIVLSASSYVSKMLASGAILGHMENVG